MSYPCIGICSFFASRRLARSHCEKRGKSDGTVASARSGCAKQRSLSCPLSERRRRHPRLFAVLDLLVLLGQAKSTKKIVVDFQSAQRLGISFHSQPSPRKFSCSFFRRKSQRKPRGENCREAAARLAERSQKTELFCTIVPGARCATVSSPDIFTSRDQAGLWPAKNK